MRLVLWPRISSILVNVLCILEQNMYSADVGENFYQCQVKLVDNLFKFSNTFLIFCLLLSVIERGVLKASIITLYLSTSFCSLMCFCFMYFEAIIRCINFYIVSSWKLIPFHYKMTTSWKDYTFFIDIFASLFKIN